MTTQKNTQHLDGDDDDYIEKSRDDMWQQLSTELGISNTAGRRMQQARRRNRGILVAGCLLFCIGSAFLLAMTGSNHNGTAIPFATLPQGGMAIRSSNSLVITSGTPVKKDTVTTVIIREVKTIYMRPDVVHTDSSKRMNPQDYGPAPRQLQPVLYVDPTPLPHPKPAQNTVDENDIWDVLQKRADRKYLQEKKNKKDSGFNKKPIDLSPTEINH